METMKNYNSQPFVLAALVLFFLLLLSAVSKEFSFQGIPIRKMDILQDVRNVLPEPMADATVADSLAVAVLDTTHQQIDSTQQSKLVRVDSSYFGNSIEDYSAAQTGLQSFFAAIDSIKTHQNKVRVAFFGDSFVEGDILLGDMRDTLQTLWGGNGVGFVPITSEVARFKRTLKHEYRNWTVFSIVKNQNDHSKPYGINGYVYYPQPEASVRYDGMKYFKHTALWGEVRLFYAAEQNVKFVWQNKDFAPQEATLTVTNGKISQWKWSKPENDIAAFAVRFPDPTGLSLYGAALENGPGFYLDNFSVRGNTGGKLRLISKEIAQQFDKYQQYDLIVVQIGLNAVTSSLRNIPWYKKELEQTFDHLKACFPDKPILLVSVADKGGKVNGELATMPSVPAIVNLQRELAQSYGFLFWDMYSGMGGSGTMIRFAQMRPHAWANTDYTHLTHEGGKIMGNLFAKLLINEKAKLGKPK